MQSKIAALWETYYIKKPLTFWEFVEKQTNLKQLFGCIEIALKSYEKEFERNPYKVTEVYASGAVGIGKGVYAYMIVAYRLYLAMLLKNPKEEIFKFAPSSELSCMFAGEHCDGKLIGFLHFLQGIQNPEDPLFVFEEGKQLVKFTNAIVIYEDENGKYSAHFNENKIAFRTAKSVAELIGTNPLIVDYDADLYETSIAMRFLEQIQNRMRSRFGSLKDLLTCLLIEKSPNNLYNDLIDQHIWKIEKEYKDLGLNESKYLVERFVPIYMKNVKTANDLNQLPKNTHFIDISNGIIGCIEDLESYIKQHPSSNIREFPASVQQTFTEESTKKVFVKEDNLLDLAREDPKRFVNEVLGEPIPNPYKTTIEVKDALGALQTVRKLIVDYQMQFTFDKEGVYLAIPELNTKLKV